MGNRTDINIDKMKQRLLQMQQELVDIIDNKDELEKPVELDQTIQGRLSRMDAMQMQAMVKATRQRNENALIRINAALKRIEDGDYGYCVITDDPIEKARLDADPATPTCLAAAT